MAKKNEASSEIAVKESSAVSTNSVPEHLQRFANMGGVGLENIRQQDMLMPRLAIAQQMSPQMQKNDPLYIENLEVGEFFNTLTNEIYGVNVIVTPLFQFPSRIYFAPRGAQGPQQYCSTREIGPLGDLVNGPLHPSSCEDCPHAQFQSTPRADSTIRPDCTLFYNYVLVIHKDNGGVEPAIFSAKSKAIRPAKKLNSLMRTRVPQLPAFTMKFIFSSVPEKAAKGTFFNFVPRNAGNVEPQVIDVTETMFNEFSNKEIKVDMRGVEQEDEDFAPADMVGM